jgi:prepilin-type N-terminal cleavage/methylation domain-containing protein
MIGHLRDERGFTLTELIIAALIFSAVSLAMGAYYVWGVRRTEEGFARAELQQNGSLVVQAIGDRIRGAYTSRIPGEGETSGQSSITVRFRPEPYDDENLNGQWDASGALGPCSPMECFQDLNGNKTYDAEVKAAVSFRLYQGRLEVRQGEVGQAWQGYLDDRYPEAEASSVWMDELAFTLDAGDSETIRIRFVLRDDLRTPGESDDDVTQSFELRVRSEG